MTSSGKIPEKIYAKIRTLYNTKKITKSELQDFVQEMKNVYKEKDIKVKNSDDLYMAINYLDQDLKNKFSTILNVIEPTGGYEQYAQQYATTTQYFKDMISSGEISKTEASKFRNEMKTVASRYGLSMKTGEDLSKVLSKMSSEQISKYSTIYNKFQEGLSVYNLEKTIGSEGTQYVYGELSQDGFNQALEQIKNDPKFQEFWNKYTGFIKQDYGITLTNLDEVYNLDTKQIDLSRQEAQTDLSNLQQDVATYMEYANDDYVTELAKTDVQLSSALQKATETYGQRNLLRSGLSRMTDQNIISEGMTAKEGLQTDLQRSIAELQTKLSRGTQSYNQIMQSIDIGQSKLDQQYDMAQKKANLGYEQSMFQTDTTKNEQAYTQASNNYLSDMNNKISSVLKYLYK